MSNSAIKAVSAPQFAAPAPAIEMVSSTDQKIANVMGQIIEHKEANRAEALENRSKWAENPKEILLKGKGVEAAMIGGDVLTAGYLAFESAKLLSPSFASLAGIGTATLVLGEVAGLINVVVAGICLVEGLKALEKGDKKLATRLLVDALVYSAIGLIMMITSVAAKLIALGAAGATLVALVSQPWLLPILFVIVTYFTMREVCGRVSDNLTGKDLGSEISRCVDENGQVDKKKLLELIEQLDEEPEEKPYNQSEKIDQTIGHALHFKSAIESEKDDHVKLKLIRKMEQLEASMGIDVAIETFRLLKLVLENSDDELQTQYETLRGKISEWNRAQNTRLFQQALYVSAFAISMLAIPVPVLGGALVVGIVNALMSLANVIPGYMDTKWPFKRNVPIGVDPVKPDQLSVPQVNVSGKKTA